MVYIVASPYGHVMQEVPHGPYGYTGNIVFQGTNLGEALKVSKAFGYPVFTYNEDYHILEEIRLYQL